MSENEKQVQVQPDPRTLGMTREEIDKLQAYTEAGLPGVTSVKDGAILQMMQMFMEGSTYNEICNKTRTKKEIVLYYSFKYSWSVVKQAHIDDLIMSLNSKIEIQKLENASFVVETTTFLREYFQEKMGDYRKTKDQAVFRGINFKLLDKYIKLIDIMNGNKPTTTPAPPTANGQNLTVNVHATGGSTVNLGKPSDGKVDQGSLLKSLADLERAKEEATKKKG